MPPSATSYKTDRITERAFRLAYSTVNTYGVEQEPEYLQPCPCEKQGIHRHLARDHYIYVKGDKR